MKRRLGIFIALCCVIMFTFTACADKEGNTNNSGNNTGTDNTLDDETDDTTNDTNDTTNGTNNGTNDTTNGQMTLLTEQTMVPMIQMEQEQITEILQTIRAQTQIPMVQQGITILHKNNYIKKILPHIYGRILIMDLFV